MLFRLTHPSVANCVARSRHGCIRAAYRTGLAIREKVDDAAAFEIADDAAVALATLPGPIVNAD
jgi:hypothetical protein